MSELVDLTLAEASLLIAGRDVSAVELLEATLERIDETEPVLHAYAVVTAASARAAAATADEELGRGAWRGPLHGIPIGVKDLLYTADAPTEGGSRVLAGFRPQYDATVVRRLRDAGAVLVGKTVTHEFAYGQNVPPTRNAWAPDCYPGGSSAGSGVAVAARSACGAIGTDTGASIRVPAAVNGVVGLKPTFGRVSRRGVIAMSPSLDHVGPLARTVEDCALLLQAIAGHDPRDATTLEAPAEDYVGALETGVGGVRIGIDRDYYLYEHVADDVRGAVLEAVAELEREGAKIVDVRIPELDLMGPVGLILVLADASAYHRRLLRTRAADYDPATRLMLELGELIPATAYLLAQQARARLRNATRDVFRRHRLTALAAPTTPTATMPIEQLSVALGADAGETALSAFLHHNIPSNLTGQPALSVPCGFSAEDRPIGLQLIGRPLGEAQLFQVARAYERAQPWHQRKPTIPATEAIPA